MAITTHNTLWEKLPAPTGLGVCVCVGGGIKKIKKQTKKEMNKPDKQSPNTNTKAKAKKWIKTRDGGNKKKEEETKQQRQQQPKGVQHTSA